MNSTMTNSEKKPDGGATFEQTRQPTFMPQFDIWEGDDELLLMGDLPGVDVDDLDIRYENRELTIHGKVSPRTAHEMLYSEYAVGDFHRTFAISDVIAADKISAQMCNGVLKLHLPKSEKIKPRRIEVNAV